MKYFHRVISRALQSAFQSLSKEPRQKNLVRRLFHEQLEGRRVLTLPATQTFAEGDMIVYNGPTVDLVNDTPSFDAFIDFGGDIDSYYFAPQFSGTYTINIGDFGNTVDPEVAVYIASTGAQVGYNDDLSAANDDARLIINLVADIRYIIAVADQPGTTSGNLSIIVTAPSRTGSFLLTPDVFGDATVPVLLDVNTDIDYYSFTAPADATGNLTVSATGSSFNHRFALFNSAGTLIQGPLISLNVSSVTPNQEYRIAVYSDDYASSGSLTMSVNFAETGAIVTNVNDSGPGSLRQAILDANAHPNAAPAVLDKIIFAIPGAGPFTIALASALPDITEAVEIEGGTQPGTGATPTIAIDGSGLTGAIDGLRILADSTVVRKLNIRKFPSDGIEVQASGVLLEDNTIGGDWGGLIALGNAENGIQILGGSNRINSNLVSGNGFSGIAIVGDTSDNNVVNANVIGAKTGGNVALPNATNGISIIDGDSTSITNNVVSGNTLVGIGLSGSATTTNIAGNKIGTRASGNAALPNGGEGILVQSPGNQIGGNTAALRNVISGNGKTGITVSGATASNNVIEGNFIGTRLNGTAAIPNTFDGIRVIGASNTRIGSTTDTAARNVISGNGGSGVAFLQAGSTGGIVAGNFIGTSSNGLLALGNTGNGVLINSGATNVEIGGSTGIAQNVISANGANGVTIAAGANGNRVSRNRIGTTLTGAALGNAGSGIFMQSSNNTIGGATAAFANTIAGNTQGITVSGAGATNNTISFNTIGTDTASNVGRGIQFSSGASSNTVGPNNTIRRNETGILVNADTIRNRITRNSIGENINLGIDLFGAAGATPNDGTDVDTGGNLLQNFPSVSGNPLLIGTNLEIGFSVPSLPANAAYPLTIEFFLSDGGGEGATFLGTTVYTSANFTTGIKTVSFAGAGSGLTPGVSKIVGTATDANGNTSEFSPQRTVASGVAFVNAPGQGAAKNSVDNSNLLATPSLSSLAIGGPTKLAQDKVNSNQSTKDPVPTGFVANRMKEATPIQPTIQKSKQPGQELRVNKNTNQDPRRESALLEFVAENL